MSSSLLPPVSIQEVIINVSFNSQLWTNTLMGLYTAAYFSTLYIYSSKNSSKSWLVIGAISMSYLTFLIWTCILWFFSKEAFVNNSQTQANLFLAIYQPIWNTFMNDLCMFILAAIADGLLIWRCFNVWGRSFWAIAGPSFLLFCEIGLAISVLGIQAATKFNAPLSLGQTTDVLIGVSLFVTFVTTTLTTILIAYRIHSGSKQDIIKGTRTRLNHILEILIQSAAAYSLLTFVYAITMVIPVTASNFDALAVLNGVLAPTYSFIAGVAPTIMVARVALSSNEKSDISVVSKISGLQFQSVGPNASQSGRESVHSAKGDPYWPRDSTESEAKQEVISHAV